MSKERVWEWNRFLPTLKSMGFEPVIGDSALCWSGRNWWVKDGVFVATKRGLDEVTILRDRKTGPIYKMNRRDSLMMLMRILHLDPLEDWQPVGRIDPRVKHRLLQFRQWYMKLRTDPLDAEVSCTLVAKDKTKGIVSDLFHAGKAVQESPDKDKGK